MIRPCEIRDFQDILDVIQDAARAYHGVIPSDRYQDPYMSSAALEREIQNGVKFWCYEDDRGFAGVMGIQGAGDVTLIRHAYVRTARKNQGIGSLLLRTLLPQSDRPVLVGTWRAARWAVRFYEKHGFRLVTEETKNRLLRNYWTLPDRQIETSVVLGDALWHGMHPETSA